jgi:Lon protease-like protein
MLNVWQPQYTHMFEGIISGPKPWLYVHLQLPGGTENLGKPEFDLRIGTQAPMVGTLMRIVSVERSEDARLILAVQGISRVRVLEATQTLPYSRANVQLLPDIEQWQAYEPRAAKTLEAADTTEQWGELDLGVPRLNDQPVCQRQIQIQRQSCLFVCVCLSVSVCLRLCLRLRLRLRLCYYR